MKDYHMKQLFFILTGITVLMFSACRNTFTSDASGTFEADEVIVSSEQSGKLISFKVSEGDNLEKNALLGQIDVSGDKLKVAQVEASIHALSLKTNDPQAQTELVKRQLALQESQMSQLQHERIRMSNLLAADAATQKQLDDINSSIDQLNKQLEVTKQQLKLYLSNINTQNRSILSEQSPLQKSVAQIQNQIDKGQILSPIKGTVLTKYAYEGEMTTVGKALFKIANLDTITLKAYISGLQLPQVSLGQQVNVLIDNGKNDFKKYTGTISWIAAKSEFTPKTIQTKDERANLVYAIKVRVRNDGYLKIGMYGEVKFK